MATLLLWVATAASASPATAAQPSAPALSGFARQLPLTITPGAALQRLSVPMQALVAVESGAYHDVRLFNGDGLPLPMARVMSTPVAERPGRVTALKAYPLADTAPDMATGQWSLQLNATTAEGQIQFKAPPNTAAQTPAAPTLAAATGVLLDTRALVDPAQTLELALDLPPGQTIQVSVQSSSDLQHWQPISQTALFQSTESPTGQVQLGKSRLLLPSIVLKDHLLQLRWTDAKGQAIRAHFKGARVTTSLAPASVHLPMVWLAPAQQISAHESIWQVPFAAPLVELKVTPKGDNELVPFQVFGRSNPNAPWVSLGASVAFQLLDQGTTHVNAPLPLHATGLTEIRLLASDKTAGFRTLPRVEVALEPLDLVFLASGPAPYTLAVGYGQANNPYLPLASLIPNYQAGQEHTLATAQVQAPALTPPTETQPASIRTSWPPRQWVLWGVLLLGTVLLGFMAMHLMAKKS